MDGMSFSWSNISDHQHQHQETVESFVFGSGNIFSNPIQDLRKTDSVICSRPISRQMGSHQLPSARMGTINAPSSFGTTGQYWSQPLAVNGSHEGKNLIQTTATGPSLESLDCLLSATNRNTDTSTDHDDSIPVIFSDYKNICKNDITVMNNLSGFSSGESLELDDSIGSRCSSEKIPSNACRVFDDNAPKPKRHRSDPSRPTSSNINFRQTSESEEPDCTNEGDDIQSCSIQAGEFHG